MTDHTKQSNKFLAIIIMAISFLIIGTNNADAINFDLPSVAGIRASDSGTFGYLSSFLKTINQLSPSARPDEKTLLTTATQKNPITSPGFLPISKLNAKNEPAVIKELVVTVTAYSSTPDQTDDDPFTMANGHHVHDGVVAANFLPFGTKIKIPELYGNKIFTVEDRMNKRFPHRIDIWFSTDRKTVDDFGVQNLKIQIINP